MTKLLEIAFKKASELPEASQDEFAKWILKELEMDKAWEKSFSESEDILENLADEAIKDFNSGKTQELDPEKL